MKKPKRKKTRNAIAVAMRERFPRGQTMRDRRLRRAKDKRNHWSRFDEPLRSKDES